jgi:hypothetical protein
VGTVRRLWHPDLGVISAPDIGVKVGAVVERLIGAEWDTTGCQRPTPWRSADQLAPRTWSRSSGRRSAVPETADDEHPMKHGQRRE